MANPSRRVLTVLDPTSLVGRELSEHLAERAPGLRVAFFHTGLEDEHLIAEVAGQASLVTPLGDLDELLGNRVVVATRQPPPIVAARLVSWLRANPSVVLVDLTERGLAPEESVVVFDRLPATGARWLRPLDPSLVGAAYFLRAMASLDPEELHATTVRPASAYGEGGVEDLAAQGIARLSGQQPPHPTALPSVLAFDLAPAADAFRRDLERQLRDAFPGVAVRVRPLEAGIFHGHLTTVGARLRHVPRIEAVRALLREDPIIRLSRRNETPHPSDAVGSFQVTCADLAVDPPWVFATLTADGLRLATVRLAGELVLAIASRAGEEAAPVH